MGYRYRKHNNRLVLIAQPHIILKRIKFIRKYLEYLQSDNYIPGDQKGLFKLAVELRKFFNSVIYNTAPGYVLLVYLTNI
jgi:hypothetical protein